jgi:RimJ/RimL family protein N-acetyltransferase
MRCEHGEVTKFEDTEIAVDGFVLRGLVRNDVEALVRACRDPRIQRWLPLPSPYKTRHALLLVEHRAPEQQESGAGLVRAIDTGEGLAGVIDLRKADWRARSVEISYWTAPWARGQRLASRATTALTAWAFTQGIGRVELRIATGNDGSLRSARRAGFVEEGTLRRAGVTHDGPVDLAMLSRLDTDPPPR